MQFGKQGERRTLEAQLRKAERERGNLIDAVKRGKAKDSLLDALEQTDAEIARLRAEMEAAPKPAAVIRTLPGLVERYARNLRAVLGRDVDRARELLRALLGSIVLVPEGKTVYAEVRGNLEPVLEDVSSNWCRGRDSNPHGVSPSGF